jgi:threonine dehydrogenase-like Zn-dependent dehydrogenase
VYGAIFTRGPQDLQNTALFLGGSDVARAERMLAAARETFFGPFRTSVMLDPNGSNTTAAAAVLKAVRALGGEPGGRRAAVLAGTGPVGTRVAGLLSRLGVRVLITSRGREHGEAAVRHIRERFGAEVELAVAHDRAEGERALQGAELLVACGPTGVRLVPRDAWEGHPTLRVAADVNAVPPLGVEGVEVSDDGVERGGARVFGAIAIGNLKMKLHKACIAELFAANDRVLDAEAIYELATTL